MRLCLHTHSVSNRLLRSPAERLQLWNTLVLITQDNWHTQNHHHHHNHSTALFPGPPGWAGARRELVDFMMQGKINTGRHTDHPAGRHSILTNQCPPPPSPIFYRPDALPAAQPTASKHWRHTQKQLTIWISRVDDCYRSRLNNLNVKDAFHHHTFQSQWSDCSIPDSSVTDSRTESHHRQLRLSPWCTGNTGCSVPWP